MSQFSFYHTKRWQKLRQRILNRDCICQVCYTAKPTIAHHKVWITPENINIPELVWGEKNLISVCQSCHNLIHHGSQDHSCTIEGYEFDENGELKKISDEVSLDKDE